MKVKIDKNELLELVREGYRKGLLHIVYEDGISKYGCMGIVCKMNDNEFYFDPLYDSKFDSVEEYLAHRNEDAIVRFITNAILGIHIDLDDEEEGEASGYYYYLKRNLAIA